MSEATTLPSDLPLDWSTTALDLGLTAAFGPVANPAGDGELEALWAGADIDLRVRGSGAAANAPVRYQLFGEIARGGMGVILQGRDNELARDVVFKVLREDHQDSPTLRQRFVDEARVGGRSQHPGVVPVYELGRFDDRPPYFTMKLVQGRTLGELLAARANADQDLPRLLKVFEQVCQTVAYAHSKGVIHRDLKPANVMVGEFGEVLVIDWGLARVRGTGFGQAVSETNETAPSAARQTQAGTVMGTLAYMAPEQARGEVGQVDERSDVFALGAMLCEILTGQPPYVGTFEDVRRRAEAGDVAAALERLEKSGAESAMRTLARTCLAPEKGSRPAFATAVADTVAAHRSAVEERLRQAERASAAADARAEAEARARREAQARAAAEQQLKTSAEAQRNATRRAARLGTAVMVMFLVAVGGGWWGWSVMRDASRRATAREAESRCFLALARQQYGQLAEAAETLRQVLVVAPDYVPAHLLLGDVLAKQKNLGDAVASYRKATELQPENALAYNKLGIALMNQGQVDDAVPVLRRAVELDAKNHLARHKLGVALERQEKFDDAAAAYREGLKLVPKDAETMLALGNALSANRDLAGAIATYQKAIDLKPDLDGGYLNLGLAFLDRKDYSAAAIALRNARALKPNDLETRKNLGVAFAKLGLYFELQGDSEDAIAAYRSALEVACFSLPIASSGGFDALERLRWILKDQDTDDDTLVFYRKALRHLVPIGAGLGPLVVNDPFYESLFEV
jgi:tetratricopeptide (TPR) repeat protein